MEFGAEWLPITDLYEYPDPVQK